MICKVVIHTSLGSDTIANNLQEHTPNTDRYIPIHICGSLSQFVEEVIIRIVVLGCGRRNIAIMIESLVLNVVMVLIRTNLCGCADGGGLYCWYHAGVRFMDVCALWMYVL